MAKAKNASKPHVGLIWFIGGPLDNHVFNATWRRQYEAVDLLENGVALHSTYRLQRLVTRAARDVRLTGNPWFDDENDGPTEFLAYVHETVTHSQLIERVYLTGHQPQCAFELPMIELGKSLDRACHGK